ncbi:borneol dehydrogenase, mitochondrial-like [Andrographis paniculata]|uniref:borneol dehydrogenase, mitochondrial-like n=1 Tax=Andrographis paniculata TaxID=175694 RepID=UPI0021E83B25|nr:borneol dehydrogenase, mitochondrial-like [Andrographis paniculata]
MASTSVKRLEGKVALITGAASGIGEATARLFSEHGAKVVIADIQDDLGQKVANDLGSSSAIFVHCDVTIESDVKNAVDTAVSKFGRLDIMHNNAGVAGEPKRSILESTQSDFENVIKVNLVGYFLGTKHAARVMIPNRSGCVIMTASVAGVVAASGPHAYTSSKFGIVGLTKNTAVELGSYGIRVNSISPYLVDTPLARDLVGNTDSAFENAYTYLNGKILTKEDIAEAALYLASDEAMYVSGHNLVVDGGFSIANQQINYFAQSN